MERITCVSCENVRLLEDWTKKQKALRCEDPGNGERWGWIVQIWPSRYEPSPLPAPCWCHRVAEKEEAERTT